MIRHGPNPFALRNFVLRLVFFAAILLALGRVFAIPLVTPLLPAFGWLIEAYDNRFRVDSLSIATRKAGTMIESKIRSVGVIIVDRQRALYPDAKLVFTPSALVGSVLQPIILLLSIVLAWPLASGWALTLRLLLSAPMILFLLGINFPLGLIGAMLDFREILPSAPIHPMVYWNDFLQTGGPLALAAAGGVLVVSSADAMARQWFRLQPESKS
ncbi:MAG: hypothetical protein ACKVQA_12775 [Burkholderiales bacterium]